jgi:hypothetical protein
VAAGGLIYAGWVNIVGAPAVALQRELTTDQIWRQQSVAPVDWSHDDVSAWATGLGLRELAVGLRKNGVDGQLLLTLSEQDVRKDLGVSNDLQVRKITMAIEKLRRGDSLPPSASRQGLLLQGLNSSEPAKTDAAHLSGAHKSSSSSSVPPVSLIKTYSLYRIWQKMSDLSDPPFMTIDIDTSIKSFDHHLAKIREDVLKKEGAHAGISPARSRENGRTASGATLITLKHRNGESIENIDQLPANTEKLFLLVGHELFFYPDDNVGETFSVPLPSDRRSVTVEVLANTPRLMLIKNFLSPSECEDIKTLARAKLEPSTVLAQGDQSKGENKVKDSVRTSETAWSLSLS